MVPNYHPEGLLCDGELSTAKPKNEGSKPITQLWHLNGECPEGTVPITRTKEDDILRAGSVESFGRKKKLSAIPNSELGQSSYNIGHEYAVASVEGHKYYGVSATINLWQPKVQNHYEFSLSQVWISEGAHTSINTIEAGWQVYPYIYGDNNTRLFVYWTNDSYTHSGCYNLKCSGFFQTSKKIALGASLSPTSIYGGPQYNISIHVWKDQKSGNWWLKQGDEQVGYWPASLFSHLKNSASRVVWGGEVADEERGRHYHSTTQMGSGHWPREGPGKASYFRNIRVVDDSHTFRAPRNLATFATNKDCYNIKLGKNDDFYYGGPGRNPYCRLSGGFNDYAMAE